MEELAAHFEASRPQLRAVAYRMLGSMSEADDAVQEAWLRLSRNHDGIENLTGWLTTVVARISLDMLRSRRARPARRAPPAPPPPRGSARRARPRAGRRRRPGAAGPDRRFGRARAAGGA